MHEMALSASLIDLVAEEAASANAARVTRVILEIGALSHVDPHALRFAFDASAAGTLAEGARLDIEEPPGAAWCMDCAETVEIVHRGDPCPRCGGSKLMVQSGEDMRLKALEVV